MATNASTRVAPAVQTPTVQQVTPDVQAVPQITPEVEGQKAPSVPRIEVADAAPSVTSVPTYGSGSVSGDYGAASTPTYASEPAAMSTKLPTSPRVGERQPGRFEREILSILPFSSTRRQVSEAINGGIQPLSVSDEGEARMPLPSDVAAMERIASQDVPLPNETTRHDKYDRGMLDWARQQDEALRQYGGEEEAAQEAEDAPAAARMTTQDAKTKAAGVASVTSRSATSNAGRVKPSILDREAGVQPRRPLHLSTDNAPTHRPFNVIDSIKDMFSNRFGRHGVGARIYGKMVPSSVLDLRDVGVGIQEIAAVVEQDPDMLDDLISRSLSKEERVNFTTTRTMLIGEVMDLINDHYVEVFTAKAPNNRSQDVQRRRLKVLESEQRGIYLNYAMAAMYTADFDGDDMLVSLDRSLAANAKDPMAQMVGVDGAQSLDTNFLALSTILGGFRENENGDPSGTPRDYVEDVMLQKWTTRQMGDRALDLLDDVIDSVLALSDTALLGSDEQAVAWGDLFRACRAFADAYTGLAFEQEDVRRSLTSRSDRVMSDIITDVMQGFRNIKVQHALLTIGEVVPRDTLPEAFTSGDEAIYCLIDGMVMGAVPNNFQELKVLMNGFLGNQQGKSAPFRFTADVGKMMKLDSRFRIGDEYIYHQDDDTEMMDLLQKTVKFAYSKRMATEVKAAGKSYYFTEELRSRVIKKVGFPDSVDKNGNPVYRNMLDFLNTFIEEYNRNAAMINEANLVWLTSMAISDKSNRKTVSQIRNTRYDRNGKRNISYADVASPFIEVYGTYSFDRIFGRLVDYQDYDPYGPQGRKTRSEEYDWYRSRNGRRWVKSRYGAMSLKAFSVDNHITNDRELKDRLLSAAQSDGDVVDGMVAAIADKRTSTASTFNTKVMGRYNHPKDGPRGHVSERTRDGKTVVGTMRELLTDIAHADLEGMRIMPQGTMLGPGYYAGVGTRHLENHPGVAEAMTKLAKRLADMGWVLRSGHADGSDQAFEVGAGNRSNIYMPYKNFNSKTMKPLGYAVTFRDEHVTDEDRRRAEDSVIRYHPNGEGLRRKWEESQREGGDKGKGFGYEAMRRNYFQVMGTNGEPESAFVACFSDAPGGTDQAIAIARDRGIPVFNAAEYDDLDQWVNDVVEAALKAQAGQLYRATSADQMLHVDDAVMALNATGYELFRDLNMDSTATFLMSEYGRKMIEHYDNADVIAGIRAAMVFKQQIQPIERVADELRGIDFSEEPNLEKVMYLKNQALFRIDELSEKSNVWRGIIMEMRSGSQNSAFRQLMTTAGRKGKYWKAIDFWTSEEMSSGFSSLRDVIEDLDMPWPLKCDIITDVVRWQTQDSYLNDFEVAFQLEVGGDSRFSLNGGAPSSSLKVYKDTVSASHRYANQSLRNLRREFKRASDMFRRVDGALTNTIHRLANNPHELVHIDDGMYADAILAVRDKVYAQTEKAKKHPSTNAIYSAISLQRNGGFFNDVYRYDDRMLGLQHKSQLTAADILKMLDDPNYILCVYDDYGSVSPLRQSTIMGLDHDASEQEIWDWLANNPRIASILRAGTACVIPDTGAKGYLGTRMSMMETIERYHLGGYDTMGNVKYLMRDHPVYAGIISLLTPAHGTSVRNERNRVPLVEEAVCREIYNAARDGYGAYQVMQNLGITRQRLLSLLVSDYDKFMAHMGQGFDIESIGEARDEASDIYETIRKHISKYIDEVSSNVTMGANLDKYGDIELGIDIESVASFWDAVQELSGAKVGVSTGIEGSETYRLSYWVSHMGAKDHYANLGAVAEDIEASGDPTAWNGLWTSRGQLSVTVSDDGVTTNIDELLGDGSEEVVTMVPDGYDVRDRSTDSYGQPVPSLYVSMVSKRSNGAEKFNLKAMKAGLDGTDSVTKMKGGKYLTETYQGKEYPVIFRSIQMRLGRIIAEQGLDAARLELARMMMDQDQAMGYKDMTLCNYMCIAEVMLDVDENGGPILRSLEQLVAGIKGRIGSRANEMTDDEVTQRIREIMSDKSEQGIGVSMAIDPYEMLSEIRPKSSAGNLARGDSVSAIKVSSSVFQRNYDLLREIERDTNVRPMDASERQALHDHIVNGNVKGVADVWWRSNIVREYQVIGYCGAADGSSMLANENIGPSTAVVIGDGKVTKSQVRKVCDTCWRNGTTVIVSADNLDSVPSGYVADMIPINEIGDMMIPMFDARLNGSEARPFHPQFAIFQAPFERYVISVEDPYNVFELGDAQYKFTRSMVSRVRANDNGSVSLTAMQLFPNVFKNRAYKDANFRVGLASRDVIENLICNPDTPMCTIDYGLVEGAKGWDQRVHDVNGAIERYRQMMPMADDNDGVLRGLDDIQPGDIVGWADLVIEMEGQVDHHVLAPLIPFPLHGGTKTPESFSVKDVGPVNNDGSLFSIDWNVTSELIDGFVKYFDSSGGANKGIINLTDIIEDTMRLKNGMDVDAYCAAESTDSRKIGTDRRIKTMISLMAIARMEGYNFARCEGAFPENDDIREQLSNSRLPRSFWAQWYEGDGSQLKFTYDEHMNNFLNYECRKIYENGGNPSDYLSTSFDDGRGNYHNEHVMWEFECMFDNSLNYEDSLLRFLHFVNPELCPNGIDDETEDKHFRLYRDGPNDLGAGFDRGMLQMQVPYPMSDGRISYVWSNVFVGMSFFGEDWSHNTRPNVSGASDMLDAENTVSYNGVRLSKDKAENRTAWATASEAIIPDSGSLGSIG